MEQDPLPFGEANKAHPIKKSILFTPCSCHSFPWHTCTGNHLPVSWKFPCWNYPQPLHMYSLNCLLWKGNVFSHVYLLFCLSVYMAALCDHTWTCSNLFTWGPSCLSPKPTPSTPGETCSLWTTCMLHILLKDCSRSWTKLLHVNIT